MPRSSSPQQELRGRQILWSAPMQHDVDEGEDQAQHLGRFRSHEVR